MSLGNFEAGIKIECKTGGNVFGWTSGSGDTQRFFLDSEANRESGCKTVGNELKACVGKDDKSGSSCLDENHADALQCFNRENTCRSLLTRDGPHGMADLPPVTEGSAGAMLERFKVECSNADVAMVVKTGTHTIAIDSRCSVA